MRLIDRQRWLALEPLLDQALDLAPDERARWLNEVSITSPEVAEELAALLRRQDAVERTGFLERPAGVTLAGLELGGWTLERPLGQGGAGSVWLARRSDGRFDGLAAVKLLNLELLSQSGRERFRHEGSVLARLTHPGIARLLDAGVSPSGQPYLVLEHVDGEPIDAYVRARALRKEDCVRLFLQVLDAVAHAHASLIVHRDLKPSNILVTGDGRVKLLDFGIATLLDAPVVEGSGALTPQFAAPEQALAAPVTTATDVYSAGVLLYLLLAGRHPTAEGCHSPGEILAALHTTEPAPLGLGDLDIVLAKALQKEPVARYGGILAFSDDLVRWLRHDPIRARPSSLGYHARMFVRRNRALVAAAAAVVVLAGAYVEAVVNDRERVRGALAEATLATRKAEQVTDFAVSLFEPTGRGSTIADSVTERDLLSYGAARARELSAQPVVEAQMLDLIGRIHTERGDFAGARPLLERALMLRRKALGEDHPDVATSEMHLARLEADANDVATLGAVRLFRHAYETRLRAFGPDDARTIDALYELATALHISGDFAGARPLFNEWTTTVERQPTFVSEERAKQLADMSTYLQMGRQYDGAERLMRQALAVSRALWGEQHHRVGEQLAHLGGILTDEKKYASADSVLGVSLALLRASYPEGHPEVAYALRNTAQNFEDSAQPEQARRVWLEAAAMYRRFNGERSMGFANATMHIGYAELRLGQFVQAEQTLREALGHLKGLPAAAPVAARTRVHIGEALAGQKRFAEAESLMLSEYRRLVGATGLLANGRGWAAGGLVRLYEAWGRPADAAKYRAEAKH